MRTFWQRKHQDAIQFDRKLRTRKLVASRRFIFTIFVLMVVCPAFMHGALITINDSDSTSTAQGKIDGAACGDIIEFEEGGTWDGPIEFPSQGCSGPTYTIVRRANESLIPADDTRVIEGADTTGMPLIRSPNVDNEPAMFISENGDYYDISGLSWTTQRAYTVGKTTSLLNWGVLDQNGTPVTSLADRPHHIKFHHNYVYGGTTGDMRNAIYMEVDDVEIRDNVFSNIHCSRNWSSECHVMSTLISNRVVIKNNELNGMMVTFTGGTDPNPDLYTDANPSDWEVSYNWMHADPEWDPNAADHGHTYDGIGSVWINKNIFEFKVMDTAHVHHNIIENLWAGDQPNGQGVLFTNLNQNGRCTWCTIADVTFEYNVIRNMPNAIQISGAGGYNRLDGSSCTIAGPRNSVNDAVVTGGTTVTSATANLEEFGLAVGASVTVGGASRTIASVTQGGNYSHYGAGSPSVFTINSSVSNGSGISLVFSPNPPTYDAGEGCSPAAQAHGLTVTNNLMYNLTDAWDGAVDPNDGKFFAIGAYDDVLLQHNTVIGVPDSVGSSISPYDDPPTDFPSANFQLKDNAFQGGTYGIHSSFGFGRNALNYNSGGTGDYVMINNAIHDNFGGNLEGTGGGSNYTSNFIISAATWEAQFVDHDGGNYRPAVGGALDSTGSDGENIGITDAGWDEIDITMAVDTPGYTVGESGGEPEPPGPSPVRLPLPIRIAWLVCPFPFVPFRRENPLG